MHNVKITDEHGCEQCNTRMEVRQRRVTVEIPETASSAIVDQLIHSAFAVAAEDMPLKSELLNRHLQLDLSIESCRVRPGGSQCCHQQAVKAEIAMGNWSESAMQHFEQRMEARRGRSRHNEPPSEWRVWMLATKLSRAGWMAQNKSPHSRAKRKSSALVFFNEIDAREFAQNLQAAGHACEVRT